MASGSSGDLIRRNRLVLATALPVSIWAMIACPGASNTGYQTCNPPCTQGTVCNSVTATCQPTTTTPPPPPSQCTGRRVPCDGQCVDPFADSSNCGGCANSCGAAAECLNGHCSCVTDADKHNCNNSWADGCECDVGCTDTACATGSTTCDPNEAWACGEDDTQKWCDNGTCKTCSGTYTLNCDGLGTCDTSGTSCSVTCVIDDGRLCQRYAGQPRPPCCAGYTCTKPTPDPGDWECEPE